MEVYKYIEDKNNLGRAPTFDLRSQAEFKKLAPVRRPRGTRNYSLTAASSRI